MSVSRRRFVQVAAAAAALPTLPTLTFARPRPRALARTHFTWQEYRVGLHVATGGEPGGGGSSLLILGKDQAALIDTKVSGIGHTLRREAEATLAGKAPLTHLINTHHHGDHIGGNPAFTDLTRIGHVNLNPRVEPQMQRLIDGARAIYRQAATVRDVAMEPVVEDMDKLIDHLDDLDAEDFKVGRTMTDELDLDIGGVKLQLRHAGAGHTDNDVFIYLPDLNVLHTGDLVFHELHPYMDPEAGANSRGWQQSLLNCLQLCDEDTIVIPGHGDVTDKTGIEAQIRYFEEMRRIIRHARDVESMTRDEIVKLTPGPFNDYGFETLIPRMLGALYDEMAEETTSER